MAAETKHMATSVSVPAVSSSMDWENINKELKSHGFAPVELETMNFGSLASESADIVVMDLQQRTVLTATITDLLKKCDHGQSIISDLVLSNKHLREELKAQVAFSEKCHNQLTSLQEKLAAEANIKTPQVSSSGEGQKPTSLTSLATENTLLQMLTEEQDLVIEQLAAQQAGQSSRQSRTAKKYKEAYKGCQKKLAEVQEKLVILQEQWDLLSFELNNKYDMSGLKELQKKVRKLEIALQPKIMPSRENICQVLEVYDVNMFSTKLKAMSQHLTSDAKMKKALHEVVSLTKGERHVRWGTPRPKHAVWCEKTWHGVIPMLTLWRQNTVQLEALQEEINHVVQTLPPQRELPFPSPSNELSVTDMIDMLRCIGEVDPTQSHSEERPASQQQLLAIARCLQDVFELKSLSHATTRIVDVHNQLQEVRNVMRTLKTMLSLGENASSTAVVDSVGALLVFQQQVEEKWWLMEN
ncbi:PREDICTED: uncharacterized protein LOC106804649 isoform X3 [Priapulus caudatus]|uniref:Centrosomal protein of 70 kDa n=1 Tax=Priapulus caudatus TaxID=37621 RepID=A0ABM1DN84_PRICU|nr:PREDICTED: uncharacterized protein LOC106804649 isoform X3 [Priapulus caudatus]